MCGIVGIVGKTLVNQDLYDALTVLQHRGQDAAGVVTCEHNRLHLCKGNGFVRDVFSLEQMQSLTGNMGIGHVRYPTAGSSSSAEAQPFYVNSPYGISLAHNGNLTNAEELAEDIYRTDLRHINTNSDSEVLLNVLAHELQVQKSLQPTPENIFKAVANVHSRVRGGYAVVAMITGYGMLAFRDPNGIRPIVFGSRKSKSGIEYMVASESVALSSAGYKLERDIAPGEAIVISKDGIMHSQVCAQKTSLTPCIFEYVYFARPDSIIDDINVYKARLKMGERLAKRIKESWPEHDIDVVIPIPDTSRASAMELAYALKVKFREGFMKNRYIGRTFIMPGQKQRKKSVKQKLSALSLEFAGKNVLLVDDSIVRGTTCEQIIEMAREAGAKKVYFASAAPPVRYPNVYGIDMPSHQELIAHNKSVEEIAQAIGADKLFFQTIEDLRQACVKGSKTKAKDFDCSVFDGKYITNDVDAAYLKRINELRQDGNKARFSSADAIPIDLHNGV